MQEAPDTARNRRALIWRYRAIIWPLYLVAVLASVWLDNRVLLVVALVVGGGALYGSRAYVIRRYGPGEWAVKVKTRRDEKL